MIKISVVILLITLASTSMAANFKGSQANFQGDKLVEEEDVTLPPPGRLCIVGGQECQARDGWHLERDRAYGGTVAIPDGADRTVRNLAINTERGWFLLTDAERSNIDVTDPDGTTIHDYLACKYDLQCHRKYGDGLRCRDTWKRRAGK